MKSILKFCLIFAAIAVVAIVGMRIIAHADESSPTKWVAVALIKVPGNAPIGVMFGHEPFDSKEACDTFRETDERYKAANAKLEARAKELGVEGAEFKYLCIPIKPPGQGI